jgi:esterase/lipase superfamily enzyme
LETRTLANVSEAWTREEAPPQWRISRHVAYDRWVMSTLLDFVAADCRSASVRPAVTGCSFGGYYAANFALKHPDRFSRAICMSGRYQMSNFTNGLDSLDVYYNNPLAFVPNLEGAALERVRQTHLTLICGMGKWEEGCLEETVALAEWCRRKGIPSTRDIWGRETYHDWPCWKQQVQKHFWGIWG